MSKLRSLLILGRVSNLPTVWSNCLAGWWLGGGGNGGHLGAVLVGASLLYIGGMFLNDAFDVEFDRAHRRERPIPSGAISLAAAWRWGLGWLGVGSAILIFLGETAGVLTVILLLCIVLYDAVHKTFAAAPALMGACRFLLYLVAASVGVEGVTGWAIWGGLALGAYVVGLSAVARTERSPGLARGIESPARVGGEDRVVIPRAELRHWPLLFLAAPILLALAMHLGAELRPALLLSGLLAIWILRCLLPCSQARACDAGRSVAGLLAGIPLVDLLAVTHFPTELVWVFPALFVLTLWLQRVVPAT